MCVCALQTSVLHCSRIRPRLHLQETALSICLHFIFFCCWEETEAVVQCSRATSCNASAGPAFSSAASDQQCRSTGTHILKSTARALPVLSHTHTVFSLNSQTHTVFLMLLNHTADLTALCLEELSFITSNVNQSQRQ